MNRARRCLFAQSKRVSFNLNKGLAIFYFFLKSRDGSCHIEHLPACCSVRAYSVCNLLSTSDGVNHPFPSFPPFLFSFFYLFNFLPQTPVSSPCFNMFCIRKIRTLKITSPNWTTPMIIATATTSMRLNPHNDRGAWWMRRDADISLVGLLFFSLLNYLMLCNRTMYGRERRRWTATASISHQHLVSEPAWLWVRPICVSSIRMFFFCSTVFIH